jgi:four helix bundle protein
MNDNIIAIKTFDFAFQIIEIYKFLNYEKKEYIMSKQLLRSGTSVGANVEEAIAAASKKDFVNKLNISAKEARETSYWLRLLFKSNFIDKIQFDNLHIVNTEIIKIINSIIITTRKNHNL